MQYKDFLGLLQSETALSCDLIIGGMGMPASLVWDEGSSITEYGIAKYRPVLEAEYKVLENGNIEIFCDDYKLGQEFCYAAAGYISITEYEKIFGEDDFY